MKPLLKAHHVDGYDYEFPLEDICAATLDGGDVTIPRAVLQEIRGLLIGSLLVPGTARYETVRKCWNAAWNRRPGVVIQIHRQMDAEVGVNFARKYNLLTQNMNDGFAPHGSLVFAKLVYSNDLSPAAMDDIVAQFEQAPTNCHWVLVHLQQLPRRRGVLPSG